MKEKRKLRIFGRLQETLKEKSIREAVGYIDVRRSSNSKGEG